MLHEDKWCKYHWQTALTLCLWIQPLAWRSCGSMLALRGPSWIKASGALAGCFWVLPLVSYAISQCWTQSGAEREQAKILVRVWHRNNAWSEHQRISEICPMEINAALLTYSKVLSSFNIMFAVNSTINVAAMVGNKQDIINRHTNSHDTTDTQTPTTPLSDCLSPSSLVLLSHTRLRRDLVCVKRDFRYEGRLIRKRACMWTHLLSGKKNKRKTG